MEYMDTYDLSEHIKNVYAEFGLALYLAQVLEHGIVNALMVVDLLAKNAGHPMQRQKWIEEFDSFMDRHFAITLGKMINRLKELIEMPDDLESLLSDALSKRNYLAHHYFRERAEEFISYHGREQMVAELEDVQRLFRQADERLESILKPLRERYGISDEQLKRAFEGLRSAG
jgi:hypothetical protein